MRKVVAVAFVVALSSALHSPAQAAETDLNTYYRFPVSIGFEYQSLTAFSSFNVPYSVFDASGTVTLPIPTIPVLQPFARLGYTRFNSLDTSLPGKWDHYHLYGALGLAWVNKLAKNFEAGADASAGISEAIFPNVVDTGAVGSPYLLLGAGGRFSLTPSYSFSLDFNPSIRYQLALSPLDTLNGFLLSLGISASFRFGEDPDSARALIRSLRFENVQIPPAFSAMQSYYTKNPIGRVTIVNTEKQPVTDVEVSFNQKEYMDSPTPSFSTPTIEPGKSLPDVPLRAVFNSRVYDLEGGLGYTPLTGEVIVSYKAGGRSAEQRYPVTYNLYDKRAMTWDDDQKAAAFITPLDRALKNYTAYINEASKAQELPEWNRPLQIAMEIYDALREIGIFYQDDPAAPFSKVQADRTFVDFISMPRDTLVRRYGDCKNLTVLYCSLLETKSIRTGFITVPGHIYPVFDTGQPAADYRMIHPDRSMTLAVDGTLWLPVEVTLLDGKSDFLAAWQRAIDEWKTFEKERRFYRTRDAQSVYSPVAIQQTDLGLQYGNKDNIVSLFSRDRDATLGIVLAGYAAEASRTRDKKDYNRLGIVSARLKRYPEAEDAFTKALKADPKYAVAMVNLGNVAFLRGDYARAIEAYKGAVPLLGAPGKGTAAGRTSVIILVNSSRAYAALKKSKEAADALAAAARIDPDEVKGLAAAAPGAGSTEEGRAAGSAPVPAIRFAEEEP